MTFGERLVYARELRGYNQKQFAEVLEVTPTRLNYWEKDKRQPDVLMIWKIISALKISGNWLIGEEGNIEIKKKYHSHIRDLRLEKGFPIKGVADALEIPLELYEKYESDEIVPDERTIFYIANFFGCSINYVLGKSDSKEVSEETDSLDEFFEDNHLITESGSYSRVFLSPSEFDHIRKYRALSERGKNVVDSILNNEYDWSQTTNKNE